jgi:hypothetical protein
MPECWLLFRGEVLLNTVRILRDLYVNTSKRIKMTGLTPSISRASITCFQSASTNLKAAQGMCLRGYLSRRKVVIGPYILSAEVTNNLIGYKFISEMKHKQRKCRMCDMYLTKIVCFVKHIERGSPSNITM